MLERAKQTLKLEAEAILTLMDRLDEAFEKAVDALHHCTGRVVVTGIGKSGIIAKKVAATLASTGTPALFLHPAEGSHGDMGVVTRQDVMIVFSNSGETQELLSLLPSIKRLGITLISLTGRPDSTLAEISDVMLDVSVDKEACPMGLAPTTSTTAALAMGDALAVTLLEQRRFGPEDFARLHPGGNLGKRLLLRVSDLMHTGNRVPLVAHSDSVHEAVLEMTGKRLGMTGVTNRENLLIGIITDGDLRRRLGDDDRLLIRRAEAIMTSHPETIAHTALAVEALEVMQRKKITALFVMDHRKHPNQLTGVLHLHDLLEAGLT